MSNAQAKDAMIRRLESELEERSTFVDGLIASAEERNRDLNDAEMETISGAKDRIGQLHTQLDRLDEVSKIATETRKRARDIDQAITVARGQGGTEIEYRSAGEYALDMYKQSLGDREAGNRLEVYLRAAAHQKTPDNLGVVPDPVLGTVINFIDVARSIVSFLGARPLPSSTWHRPKVTQHTSVAKQGAAGGAADEKSELVSQKMIITRLTANAITYGGYVNVSRQNIDFSQPSVLDLIVTDLAQQYAIETESATCDTVRSTTTPAVGYGAAPTGDTVAAAVWKAVAQVYTAVRGQGSLVLAVAPDTLGLFGPLFAPVNPQSAQSPGFEAGAFRQGAVGTISGVPVVMSAGLDAGEAFVLSTSAIEVYEQRVGTLQITEPSVLGLQVAYAGYFTPLKIEDAGIVPLTAT